MLLSEVTDLSSDDANGTIIEKKERPSPGGRFCGQMMVSYVSGNIIEKENFFTRLMCFGHEN